MGTIDWLEWVKRKCINYLERARGSKVQGAARVLGVVGGKRQGAIFGGDATATSRD
jgi:hypothetical protein